MNSTRTPVIGFSAYSGTGKTTLLKKLIPLLREKGLRLAVIKHAHHDFEIDHPGKDSFELRKAAANQVLISSARRKALITEFDAEQQEPSLEALIEELDHSNLDLVLVEGFKREHFNKIELNRASFQRPFLYPEDGDIIALATDREVPTELPVLDINQPGDIAEFIYQSVYRSDHTARDS